MRRTAGPAVIAFGGREPWKEASRDEYRSRPLEDFRVRSPPRDAYVCAMHPDLRSPRLLTLAIGNRCQPRRSSAPSTESCSNRFPFLTTRTRSFASIRNDRKKRPRSRGRPRLATSTTGVARGRGIQRDGRRPNRFGLVYSGPEGEEQLRTWSVTKGLLHHSRCQARFSVRVFCAKRVRPPVRRALSSSPMRPGRTRWGRRPKHRRQNASPSPKSPGPTIIGRPAARLLISRRTKPPQEM